MNWLLKKRMNKKNHKILLIDPRSVRHGPPQIIKSQDTALTSVYSKALDNKVDDRMHFTPKQNSNAVNNRYVSSYGLLMLGSDLKRRGFRVDYINGDYYHDSSDFLTAIIQKSEDCKMLCFTGTTPQYREIEKIAEQLLELYPDKLLSFGGPHSYFFKNHYESNPFHIIFIGHNITRCGEKIEDILYNEVHMAGCSIHMANGYNDVTKDFSLIPTKYLKDTLLYSYISFGCPNNCRYCVEHYFTNKVCFLSLQDKFKEIEFLVNRADVKSVHLADSDFLINSTFASEFLSVLERKELKCCFTINTSPAVICRAGTISLIKRFANLGLIELLIGVEYLSDEQLNRMNKKYHIADFYEAILKIRTAVPDLIISFYSLIGLPGETSKTIKENLLWTSKFKKSGLFDFSFPKFFVPYPGTDVYENPEKHSVIILHNRFEEYHRWSLPRPISVIGMSDDSFIDELVELYSIGGTIINEYKSY